MSQPGSTGSHPDRSSRPARRPPGTAPVGVPAVAAGGSPPLRPRWGRIAVVALVLVVIVVGAVWAVRGSHRSTPAPAAATVLVPSPTPTVTPVARAATTAFATSLPTSVLQFALASSAADPDWVAKGALEAYTETFSDGGSGTLTLHVGQWATSAEADAMVKTLVTALPTATATAGASPGAAGLPASGSVRAGAGDVGTYRIVDDGDGTGTAVWNNGTAVLRLTAPVGEVLRAFSAFPL